MDLDADLTESDFVSCEKRVYCVITATRRGFSSSAKHEASEFNDYVIDNDRLKSFFRSAAEANGESEEIKGFVGLESYFRPKFYANGDCEENEGYVSILFYGTNVTALLICSVNIEINFTVAIIDADGNKRFRQSSSYVSDPNSSYDVEDRFPKFGLHRYLKRETVWNEPEELLPDDCLTVYLEVDFSVHFESGDVERFIAKETVLDNGSLSLKLDSRFGRELRKLSDFFQFASNIPMKESRTRLVRIPVEEIKAFYRMYHILRERGIEFNCIGDVCEMYTVADKYCIHSMVETSRQIMKSFLCRINDQTTVKHVVKSMPMLLELAEKHGDESLKGTISLYTEIKKKFERKETKEFVYAFEEHIKEKLETDWICECVRRTHGNFYRLYRMRDNVKERGMEFYK